MTFTVDHFVLTTGTGDNAMKATMNRYRPESYQRKDSDAGFILLFAHGTGFHKELWEPTIDYLFKYDLENKDIARVIEAWCIDCQNHGEAAALNDELFIKQPKLLTVHHYAEAFASLYRSELLGTINTGLQKIVLVGHSAGAIASVFATAQFETLGAAPFDMVILIDPPLFAPQMIDNMTDMYKMVAKTTSSRRSMWDSKEEAYNWLKTRIPWKFWYPRVLELYTEHGLRSLPTPFRSDKKGVTLVCSPDHEAAAFQGTPDTLKAIEHLNKISSTIPVHAVYGARNDMFSREVQDSLHDPSIGRIISSATRVKGAGHLVVQENPQGLAQVLKDVLSSGRTREWSTASRL